MKEKVTQRIKLWGIVQGVGFRPFVAKIADRMKMKGEVLNIGGLVEIAVTDTPERIAEFVTSIEQEKPVPAEIVHIKITDEEYREFNTFTILKSDDGDDEAAMIPADLAVCPHCLEELYDESNPRHEHPFISCMVCGPRYTVIDRIPYDRHNTTMIDFPMCDFCESEYTELTDRRYHAQTISCHDCGPQLELKLNGAGAGAADSSTEVGAADSTNFDSPQAACETGTEVTPVAAGNAVLDYAAELLRDGHVLAFKSMGGYNLICDPLNDDAVVKLREIKKREQKPFAVMFRSIEQVREFCYTTETEEKLLASSARPILLLEHKPSDSAEINKSRFIGSFLPSMGAQYLLLDRISPLIVTSANLSSMPIIKDDEEMAELMQREPLISGVISNARRIQVRVDDSVARVIDGQPQMIRRSKGYAPVPLYVSVESSSGAAAEGSQPDGGSVIAGGAAESKLPDGGTAAGRDLSKLQILATGAQLKNSFALTKGPFVYVSQFFGDMDSLENQAVYEENVDRMADLFRIRPELVVCDMHPLYYTTEFANKYAGEHGDSTASDGTNAGAAVHGSLPVLQVQHHHAHVASVMAEHDLQGPVIGVSMDGTGYGTDGAIWGGEFLLCEGGKFERKDHLRYVKMLGGDSSMKEGWKSAVSYLHAWENDGYGAAAKAQAAGKTDGAAARAQADGIARGTDAVGAEDDYQGIALDLSDIIEFAMKREDRKWPGEQLARAALKAGINTITSSSMGRLFDGVSALLGIKDYNDYEGQCAIMLEDAAAFPEKGEANRLAREFHLRVARMILDTCLKIRKESGADQVALTGGVFQNKILMEESLALLREHGFKPYYNISVSPNDGGIALGQAYVAMKLADYKIAEYEPLKKQSK